MINEPTLQMPQAPEMEAAVLGALLVEPSAMTQVVTILNPEHFGDPVNGRIYAILRAMYDANEQTDLYTVSNRCKADTELKDRNIIPLLARYTQQVGSGAHVTSHAYAVKEKYLRRRIIESSLRIMARAGDDGVDITETLDMLSKNADSINETATGDRTVQSISAAVENALKNAERRCVLRQSGESAGITTGLAELDRITGGWQPSQLVIVAARPAMGKTAFMLHLAKSAARAGTPVCIYSLEMADVSLANRLLLSEADIDADRFRMGELTVDDWRQLETASQHLKELPIYIDDNPTVSMRYIKTRSKIMQKRGRCGMVMVDYLQLADTATDRKNNNREQEIAAASRQAKIIAKELGVPFILLSQLSRRVEERADRMPILSDLRESGAIEQDADVVSFIYRPAYYKQESIKTQSHGEISSKGVGVLSVAKQRDGATGMVLFSHNESLTRLCDYGQQPDNTPF